MSRAGGRAGAVAVLLAGLLPAWGAHAQSAPAPDDVDVTLIGGGDVDSLVDTIHELVGRLGLTLTPYIAKTAADVVPAPSARVIVEIDFTAAQILSETIRACRAAGADFKYHVVEHGSQLLIAQRRERHVRQA